MINISKRYFILGNGGTTHYHLGASDAQKYYGALSGASGTMRDGSPGYLLWTWLVPLLFLFTNFI